METHPFLSFSAPRDQMLGFCRPAASLLANYYPGRWARPTAKSFLVELMMKKKPDEGYIHSSSLQQRQQPPWLCLSVVLLELSAGSYPGVSTFLGLASTARYYFDCLILAATKTLHSRKLRDVSFPREEWLMECWHPNHHLLLLNVPFSKYSNCISASLAETPLQLLPLCCWGCLYYTLSIFRLSGT